MKRATFCLVLFLASVAVSFAAQAPAHSAPVAQGKSSNWKVEVFRSATYTKARISPNDPTRYEDPPVQGENNFNLRLELRISYLGPSAEIEAPAIAAVTGEGKRYEIVGNMEVTGDADFELLAWMMSSTHSKPDKKALKGGEVMFPKSTVTFWIVDIPVANKELKLAFADVPPFPLKLTQRY